jgi:hypothetical protein
MKKQILTFSAILFLGAAAIADAGGGTVGSDETDRTASPSIKTLMGVYQLSNCEVENNKWSRQDFPAIKDKLKEVVIFHHDQSNQLILDGDISMWLSLF